MGELRSKIMDKCPEGFEDDLKDFIDEIEMDVNTIKNAMEINSLSDLASIETAADMISDLADNLY